MCESHTLVCVAFGPEAEERASGEGLRVFKTWISMFYFTRPVTKTKLL